jgi:hypothetical protein
MPRHSLVVCALSVAAIVAAIPARAGPRAFVASYGDDANTGTSCAPTTPCRSFTAAQSVVDAGGEIIALDAAGYGAITITKSVSIIANPGFYAGIAVSSGTAVTIATPSVNVTLKGLNINNGGTATTGIDMSNGSFLAIENCVVSNFSAYGIYVHTAPASVRITDTVVKNGYEGIWIDAGANADISRVRVSGFNDWGIASANSVNTGYATSVAVSDSVSSQNGGGVAAIANFSGVTARIAIARSTLSQNAYGVYVGLLSGTAAIATIGNSMVTGNTNGFYNSGGTLETVGTNILRQNSTATFGTITPISGG